MQKNRITIDTDPLDIPWIFRNRDLTIPSTQELKEYLTILVEDDIENVRFLHRRQQEYLKFGGGNAYAFSKWIAKLKRDLEKTTFN